MLRLESALPSPSIWNVPTQAHQALNIPNLQCDKSPGDQREKRCSGVPGGW